MAEKKLIYPQFYEVTVERTVTEVMRIGVTTESEADARKIVESMPRIHADNGWMQGTTSDPVVASVEGKGPIVLKAKRRTGVMKSTGRPAP